MSIHTDCRDAALALVEDPAKEVFTELDVVLRAARIAEEPYSPLDMKMAQREASQVMGAMFRNRQVVRYGPVSLKALGIEESDYARMGAKIIYASSERGPHPLRTPNGEFPRMFAQDDSIARSGRRAGANRDDMTPWAEQEILERGRKPDSPAAKPSTPEQRENLRLGAENAALMDALREAQSEVNRLRDQIAATREEFVPRPEMEGVVASLEGRIKQLEKKRQ